MDKEKSAAPTWQVTTDWPTGPEGIPGSWRGDLGLPRRWDTRLESEDVPYTVELEMTFDGHAPTCRAMHLRVRGAGPPISAAQIRNVPVGECIEIAITHATRRWLPDEKRWAHDVGADADRWRQARRAARSPKAHTSDTHLQEVAAVYRSAPEKPTQAVSNAWPSVGYSTAARWVMEARRRGLLPPAKRSQKEES